MSKKADFVGDNHDGKLRESYKLLAMASSRTKQNQYIGESLPISEW
ncbi:MAG: hypothetical protein ACR2OT_06880 [Parvibaculales bacterium]